MGSWGGIDFRSANGRVRVFEEKGDHPNDRRERSA